MAAWIIANIGTIVVAVLLAAVLTLIILKIVGDKKKGKSSCGCNCGNCAMSGSCHKQKDV